MEQKNKPSYYEPQLDNRIAEAQARAQRLLTGQFETERDFMFVLILVIDREKKMGIFADYYQNRTLDELVFEAELTKGVALTPAEQGSKIIERAGDEGKQELGDWLAHSMGEGLDPNFMEDAKAFMETGEFKGNSDDQQ